MRRFIIENPLSPGRWAAAVQAADALWPEACPAPRASSPLSLSSPRLLAFYPLFRDF